MEKKIGHELGNVFFPGGFLIQNRLNRNFSSKRSQRVNNSVKENKTADLAWVWPLSTDVGGLGAWPHLVALQESGGIPVHGGLLRSPYPTRNTATASPCPCPCLLLWLAAEQAVAGLAHGCASLPRCAQPQVLLRSAEGGVCPGKRVMHCWLRRSFRNK